MCQLSETMSVPRVCDKTDFAANSMRLQLLKALYLKKKNGIRKKRPSQIVTVENTCSRLFPKCFFFSGAQTFCLDNRLYPEVFPRPAYISQSRRDGWIEICRAWVETSWCAVGGPLWQIYNRWCVLQWARLWSAALMPYLPLWLHNCLAEMLCRTRLASPALNSSLSSLLSTTDSLHLSFLTTLKHIHARARTRADLFPRTLSYTQKTQTICSEGCWSALLLPGCRMSCTLRPLHPQGTVKYTGPVPHTLGLKLHPL